MYVCVFIIKYFRLFSRPSTMDDLVWARDHAEGFVLARISEITGDGAEVIPLDSKHSKRVLPFSDIFRANVEKDKVYDDNCKYQGIPR